MVSYVLDALVRLVGELRKRRVNRVAGFYLLSLFVLIQLADALFDPLGIPDVAYPILIITGLVGLPPSVVLAWMLDITDEGVEHTAPGPFSDFFGGTRPRRVLTVGFTALVSLGLGAITWSAWKLTPTGQAWAAEVVRDHVPPRPALDPRRVAILGIDDETADNSLASLSTALTARVRYELETIAGLHVAPRAAVRRYQDSGAPLDSLVYSLSVGIVLEGTLTRIADVITWDLSVIDGGTQARLDGIHVQGTPQDFEPLPDSLAESVTRALRRVIGEEFRDRTARGGTSDIEAWEAYSRGTDALDRFLDLRRDDRDEASRALDDAEAYYLAAQEADPAWLDPVIGRARVLAWQALIMAAVPGTMDEARALKSERLISEVVDRDPTAAEALELRAWLRYWLSRNPAPHVAADLLTEALADVQAALSIEPERPRALWILSAILARKSHLYQAARAAERARAADVFLEAEEEVLSWAYQAWVKLGPEDEAMHICNQGRQRYPRSRNFFLCRFQVLGSFPQVTPDVTAGRALLDSLAHLSDQNTVNDQLFRSVGRIGLARIMAQAGLPDSAWAHLELARRDDGFAAYLAYDEAHVRLVLGDTASVVPLLTDYLTVQPDTATLREDWWFDPLHDYEPFRRLVGLSRGGEG